MNWSKTFRLIEQELGFELYDWQKNYISMVSDNYPYEISMSTEWYHGVPDRIYYATPVHRSGFTTAYILRGLLNYGEKIGDYSQILPPIRNMDDVREYRTFWCDYNYSEQYTRNTFPRLVIKLDQMLKSLGLETCFY
jgi:hypothetical protein